MVVDGGPGGLVVLRGDELVSPVLPVGPDGSVGPVYSGVEGDPGGMVVPEGEVLVGPVVPVFPVGLVDLDGPVCSGVETVDPVFPVPVVPAYSVVDTDPPDVDVEWIVVEELGGTLVVVKTGVVFVFPGQISQQPRTSTTTS